MSCDDGRCNMEKKWSLSKLFQTKKTQQNLPYKCHGWGNKPGLAAPSFDRDNIRLVVFRDHGHEKDRALMFDSKWERKQPSGQNERCRRMCHSSKASKVCSRVGSRSSEAGTADPSREQSAHKDKNGRPRSSADTKVLGEMIFGSVPMTQSGCSLKVHSLRSSDSDQLMVTRVFTPSSASRESSGEHESLDLYSIHSLISEGSSPQHISSPGQTPMATAHSVPMDVPAPLRRRLEEGQDNEDSGLSASVTSSSSSFLTPDTSTGSSASINSSSCTTQPRVRRWLRSRTTSLGQMAKKCSDEHLSDPVPASKRPPKFGIGIIFTLPDDTAEKSKHFEGFFFAHITLIESHIIKLELAIDRALQKKDKHMVVDALGVFRESIYDLYTAPRLSEPVWLNMMSFSTHRVSLCQQFLKDLMSVVERIDTKNTKFFFSTLLTGVLTHHLAWVATVTPAGASPASTYVDKHSAKWLDTLAKSHPYNPLWAQLGDLYGALGFPLRLSRTVVTGKKADIVCKLLYILSYFIRCSEIRENVSVEESMFHGEARTPEASSVDREVFHQSGSAADSASMAFGSVTSTGTVCANLMHNSSDTVKSNLSDTKVTVSEASQTVSFSKATSFDSVAEEAVESPDNRSSGQTAADPCSRCGQGVGSSSASMERRVGQSVFYYDHVTAPCQCVASEPGGDTVHATGVPHSSSRDSNLSSGDDMTTPLCLSDPGGVQLSEPSQPPCQAYTARIKPLLLFKMFEQDESLVCTDREQGVLADPDKAVSPLLRDGAPDPVTNAQVTADEIQDSLIKESDLTQQTNNSQTAPVCAECQISPTEIAESVRVLRVRHVGRQSTPEVALSSKFDFESTVNTKDVTFLLAEGNGDEAFPGLGKMGDKPTNGHPSGKEPIEDSGMYDPSPNHPVETSPVDPSSKCHSLENSVEYRHDSGVFDTRVPSVLPFPQPELPMDTMQVSEESPEEADEVSVIESSHRSSSPVKDDLLRCKVNPASGGESVFDEYFVEDGVLVGQEAISRHKKMMMYKRMASIEGSSSLFDEYMNEPSVAEISELCEDRKSGGESRGKPRYYGRFSSQEGSMSMFDEYFSEECGEINLPDCPTTEMVTSAISLMKEATEEQKTNELQQGCDKRRSLTDSMEDTAGSRSNGADDLARSRTNSVGDRARSRANSTREKVRPRACSFEAGDGRKPHKRTASGGSAVSRQNSTQSATASCKYGLSDLARNRHTSTASSILSGDTDATEIASSMVELPMPECQVEEDMSTSPHSCRDFGRSLIAGFTDHYMSDFVLHGTSDVNFERKLHNDLTMAVQNSVLDEPIAESTCIVADTDNWSVRLLTCQFGTSDRVKTLELTASQLVSNIIESVHDMWKLKMSPEFCLMHLEDRLQEVFFKSKMLSEYIRTHKKIGKEISTNLGLDVSDLPLLLAVAGTHTQYLGMGLGSL